MSSNKHNYYTSIAMIPIQQKRKTIFTLVLAVGLLASNTAFAALQPVKSTIEINTFTVNGPLLNNEDYYAFGATTIGDLDGDGVIDIAAGAWGNDVGGSNRGSVHISFMNADGSVKSTVPINALTTNGPVLADGDAYGVSVASLGDLDGDGVTDIAVGTWSADAGGLNRGGIHIHFLNSNGSVKASKTINSLTVNGPVLANSDTYGINVVSIGDLDGDGVTDILAGANGDDSGGANRGAVYISFMNSDGTVKSTTKISSLTPNGPVIPANNSGYGRGVSALGDLDGDGVMDIAVGAETDNSGGAQRGAVYISFLNPNGSVKSTTKISSLTPNGPALADGDRYGAQTIGLGDVNGDGIVDLGVAAYMDDSGGTDRGAFYIHLLNSDGSVKATSKVISNAITGPNLGNGDLYGTSLFALGDMDGDGWPDFGAGAGANDAGGSNRGTLYLHKFNPMITPPAPTVLAPPAASIVYNNQTPAFSGSGSRAGNIITIMDGLTVIGTATIAADLTWSLTPVAPLAYGPYNFSVFESSAFAGPSVAHPLTLVSDLIPPATSLTAPDLQAASDTGIYDNDNYTAQNLPTLDVQCIEIGSTSTLYTDNPAPNTAIGSAPCTIIGTNPATVTVPLADGTHNISYTEKDPAGNESGHSPALTVVIDTTPPGPPTAISVGDDFTAPFVTAQTSPIIVISSVAGDSVNIAGFTCLPLPASGVTVSCTPAIPYPIPSVQSVTATITDLAGNGPVSSVINFSIQYPPSIGGGGGFYVSPVSNDQPTTETTSPESAEPADYQTLSCLKVEMVENPFSDITGHFAEEAILLLASTLSYSNIIAEGYPGSDDLRLYRPDQEISRAEFLKLAMLSNCLKVSLFTTEYLPTKPFPDVPPEKDLWYNNYIYSAQKAGIVSGYEDGNFYPDQPISRAEATKILINLQHLLEEEYQGSDYFQDVTSDDWFYNYVSISREKNLVFGYTNEAGEQLFHPHHNISRAETATILARIFKLRELTINASPNNN